MKIYADLHTHSIHSDGELTPGELLGLAAKNGLHAIALTDHDSLGGVAQAAERGRELGIEVIPGCELTVYEGSMELHILGLFVEISPGTALAELLARMQDARRVRALQMARQLREAGVPIEDADVLRAAGAAQSAGRPHVAAALVQRGHARDGKQAFVKFLGEGRPGYVKKFALAPESAFAAVHAAGGVALLAHPGRTQHDELIARLFRQGMDGIEALYRSHSMPNQRFYSGLASRYEKVVCGGSDYHGPRMTPRIQPGDGGVDRATLEDLRRAAMRVRAVSPLPRVGEGWRV